MKLSIKYLSYIVILHALILKSFRLSSDTQDEMATIIFPRHQVFGTLKLRNKIFRYLDPPSVKEAALVSK